MSRWPSVAEIKPKGTGLGGSFGAALFPLGRYGAGDGWAIVAPWRFRRPPRPANDNREPLSRRLWRWTMWTLIVAACFAALTH